MSNRLTIHFTPAEGTVLRVLGLLERRGYLLRRVGMNEEPAGASLVVEVEPRDGGRRIDVIAQQLRRLIDVNSVSVAGHGAGQIA